MSSLKENPDQKLKEPEFLNVSEQQVKKVILEFAAENQGQMPSLEEIQRGMSRHGYKHLSISRLSEIRDSVMEKGHLRMQIVDGEEKSA